MKPNHGIPLIAWSLRWERKQGQELLRNGDFSFMVSSSVDRQSTRITAPLDLPSKDSRITNTLPKNFGQKTWPTQGLRL
jgi:hypothetical protein